MRDYAHFWQWCVTLWRAPRVEQPLLQLQATYDIVILEVLMAAWLATQGYVLNTRVLAAMRSTSERWVAGVVVPLREQRVAWRTEPDAEACRGAIKNLELQAEKVLGELLYSAAVEGLTTQHGRDAAGQGLEPFSGIATQILVGNLSLILAHVQPSFEAPELEKLAALLMASSDSVNSD